MKKLFMGFGILVLSIFLFMGISFAYTYEGDIDPSEFRSWTPTSEPAMCEPGVVMIPLQNNSGRHADLDAAVVYLVRMQRGNVILAFQYHSKVTGKTRYFEMDPKKGVYEEVNGFNDGTFQERYVKKMM